MSLLSIHPNLIHLIVKLGNQLIEEEQGGWCEEGSILFLKALGRRRQLHSYGDLYEFVFKKQINVSVCKMICHYSLGHTCVANKPNNNIFLLLG